MSCAQFEQEDTFPLPSEEKEYFKHKAAQIFQNPSEKLMASPQFCSSLILSLANAVSPRSRDCTFGDCWWSSAEVPGHYPTIGNNGRRDDLCD